MFGNTKEKEEEVKVKQFMVMYKWKRSTSFYLENSFFTREDADSFAELMRKQEPKENGNQYYLFEQSKHYGNGEDKK